VVTNEALFGELCELRSAPTVLVAKTCSETVEKCIVDADMTAALRDKAHERGAVDRRYEIHGALFPTFEAAKPYCRLTARLYMPKLVSDFVPAPADSRSNARSSEREVQAAHVHVHTLQQMMMFSASAVRVNGASQLRPSSRNGSAAGRCSLLPPANGLLRAECPCA
jgi:hypothetical protein